MNKSLLTKQYAWHQKRLARFIATVVIVLGGLLLNSPTALAAFKFCNSTDVTLSTAIAYHSSGEWTSAGWYNIKPGECSIVISKSLKNHRDYYIYAKGGNIRFGGHRDFCTIPDGFRIRGTNCSRKGYTSTGFRKVNTGHADSFTIDFRNLVILTPSTTGAVLVPSTNGVFLTPSSAVILTPSSGEAALGLPIMLIQ